MGINIIHPNQVIISKSSYSLNQKTLDFRPDHSSAFDPLAISAAVLRLLAAFNRVAGKIAAGKTPLHSPVLWMFGAIFVYFFVVSGGMYIIVKKMPMFLRHPSDPRKALFFYPGRLNWGRRGLRQGFCLRWSGCCWGW